VAKSEPAGGSSVPAGSEVKLFRSNATMSAVPAGITGVTVQDAKNALNSAGFTNVKAVCSDPSLPAPLITAIVASANPASGTIANRSNRVTLTVTCVAPTPPPEPPN
jgi:beta-lactam-binding protein with PASTA domain